MPRTLSTSGFGDTSGVTGMFRKFQQTECWNLLWALTPCGDWGWSVCFLPVGHSLCTYKPGVWPVATVLLDLARDSLEEPEEMLTFIAPHLCVGHGGIHSLLTSVHGPQIKNSPCR